MIRLPILALAATLPFAAHAQSVTLPPASVGDQVAAPVEIVVEKTGNNVRCEPQQARFPATDEVDLRLINRTDRPVTVSAPGLLIEQMVRSHEGDVAHAASNNGYVLKPQGVARLMLRTPKPGEYPYQCIYANNTADPFKGTLTVVENADQPNATGSNTPKPTNSAPPATPPSPR
ncbi:hypothetical protein [Salinarimonas soli]|uniref:EfeO-type cupredoxin-like domain-containing protein n=1 Tax=Salinarimonas soli TaxID=1638099 RepID=A0A5B2VYN7_9HYPH|nr:hypothetical protein [Salinarimonas soli]KAA2244155.1 hypothetical protein F0L46_01235 [Salinarimonas soli]